MGFAVDGSNTAISPNFASNTTTIAATLTTSNSCVVWAAILNRGFSHNSVSQSALSDNSGHSGTWVLAGGTTLNNGRGYLELWYTKTTAAWSAATITCTFATQTETASMVVWGEDGIGNTVLDPNGALPNIVIGNSNPLSASLTTSNAVDVGFVVGASDGRTLTTPSGWTAIANANQQNGDNYNTTLYVYYQTFIAPQSSLAISELWNGGSGDFESIVVAAQAAVTTSTRAQFSGIGF
jgi:hypothetical protein